MLTLVIGTNRPNSKSIEIAKYYQNILTEKNVDFQTIDLTQLPADFTETALYSNNGKNQVFNILRAKIETGSKFLFFIPEYNGSFPGVLKAFIDGQGYPNPLNHKKAALVGFGDGTMGGALAVSHFTDILNYLGVSVLAQKIKIPSLKKNFVEGQITDATLQKFINEQIDLFLKF